MKTHPTIAGQAYVVFSKTGCTVTDSTGTINKEVPAGDWLSIPAPSDALILTDDNAIVRNANFSLAPTQSSVSEGGGGIEISFDTSPTKDSENVVTSGGLYNCFFANNKLTLGQGNSGNNSVYALGSNNSLLYGGLGIAVGFSNTVGNRQQYGAFGQNNKLSGNRTWAFGAGNVMQDDACGCVCLCASDSSGNTFTQFYFMAANSTLATTYEAGEACMGYVTKDKSGNILAAGTQKLSALFPNNSTFAPALANEFGEFETPKVFVPNGATEPIELDPLIDL